MQSQWRQVIEVQVTVQPRHDPQGRQDGLMKSPRNTRRRLVTVFQRLAATEARTSIDRQKITTHRAARVGLDGRCASTQIRTTDIRDSRVHPRHRGVRADTGRLSKRAAVRPATGFTGASEPMVRRITARDGRGVAFRPSKVSFITHAVNSVRRLVTAYHAGRQGDCLTSIGARLVGPPARPRWTGGKSTFVSKGPTWC